MAEFDPTKDYDNFNVDMQDVENIRGDGGSTFSHEELIMLAMKKALDAGCCEMHPGWFNEKQDKFGNMVKTYMEDTRERFIECVESVQTMIECDFDEEAENNIKAIHDEIEEVRKGLVDNQWEWWCSLSKEKQKNMKYRGINILEDVLNTKLPEGEEFLNMRVKYYRKILSELNKLAKRNDFYVGSDFEV